VDKNIDRINNLGTDIAALRSETIKNAQDIQTLLNNFEDSLLRFHVETKNQTEDWPLESVVTYKTKVVDTHNAIDISSGIFTAPLTGVYGFFFFARFGCASSARNLYMYHNDLQIVIQRCSSPSSSTYYKSNSVYFAWEMQVGDTLKIYSGNAQIDLIYIQAKFMGFFLEKK